RLVGGEEALEALGVALVRQAEVGVARVRRIAPAFVQEQGERLLARLGCEAVDVHAGRDLVDALDGADDLLERLPDVVGADEDGVVPAPAPLARERACVDIRAGPPEQVPVPEENPHRRSLGRRSSVTLPRTFFPYAWHVPGVGTSE